MASEVDMAIQIKQAIAATAFWAAIVIPVASAWGVALRLAKPDGTRQAVVFPGGLFVLAPLQMAAMDVLPRAYVLLMKYASTH